MRLSPLLLTVLAATATVPTARAQLIYEPGKGVEARVGLVREHGETFGAASVVLRPTERFDVTLGMRTSSEDYRPTVGVGYLLPELVRGVSVRAHVDGSFSGVKARGAGLCGGDCTYRSRQASAFAGVDVAKRLSLFKGRITLHPTLQFGARYNSYARQFEATDRFRSTSYDLTYNLSVPIHLRLNRHVSLAFTPGFDGLLRRGWLNGISLVLK